MGSWPPQASHKVSATLTIATAVSGAYRLPHGTRQADQKHCKGKVVVGADTLGKVLLEFPHEDTGLGALHLYGELKQLKIGLSFALSELPKQNFFQKIIRLI
jgi:hypothetical protein